MAQEASCMICLEKHLIQSGLLCTRAPGHDRPLLCEECLPMFVSELIGTSDLRERGGAILCPLCQVDGSDGVPATTFERAAVESKLQGHVLRQYLEALEHGNIAFVETLPELLNVICPRCERVQDPDPDGCCAVRCRHCRTAYCWVCFEECGGDAHPHVLQMHGNYFPPRGLVFSYHRRWRWRRVNALLIRTYGESRELHMETLQPHSGLLSDVELWPFPDTEPALAGPVQEAAILSAASTGTLSDLITALDENPHSVHTVNDRGMTALLLASHRGCLEMVELLLGRGAVVNWTDLGGVSALEYACRQGHLDVMMRLLDDHERIPDAERFTTLAIVTACRHRHRAMVARLLERWDLDINRRHNINRLHAEANPLHVVAENGDEEIMRLLLQQINIDINMPDSMGRTALVIAATSSHHKSLQVATLLAKVNDIDVQESLSQLISAWGPWQATHCSLAIFEMLLEHRTIEFDLSSLLLKACWSTPHVAKSHMVQILLDRQEVNVNTRKPELFPSLAQWCGFRSIFSTTHKWAEHFPDETPLIGAVALRDRRMVDAILKHEKVDGNIRVSQGCTALHVAMALGSGGDAGARQPWSQPVLDLLLLSPCIDVNARLPDGSTPLIEAVRQPIMCPAGLNFRNSSVRGSNDSQHAASRERNWVVDLLLDRDDIEINLQDKDGFTALMTAAAAGRRGIVEMLLEREEVDLHLVDHTGQSVFDVAAAANHDAIVRLLKQAESRPPAVNSGKGRGKANRKGYSQQSVAMQAHRHAAVLKGTSQKRDLHYDIKEAMKSRDE